MIVYKVRDKASGMFLNKDGGLSKKGGRVYTSKGYIKTSYTHGFDDTRLEVVEFEMVEKTPQKAKVDIIQTRYWGSKPDNLDIPDRGRFPYSETLRNKLINQIIDAGYNVMLQTIIPSEGESFMNIFIDKYRFQQR